MVRQVYAPQVQKWTPDSEAALRQCGQFAAYGDQMPFLRFYEDDNGNRLSIFEQAATLHAVGDTEEMCLFITMDSTITTVRTDSATAALLGVAWQTSFESEAVMSAPIVKTPSDIVTAASLRDVYDVLQEGFQGTVPPFDSWYADVHHKIRHGCCRTVGVYEENELVATAMTVAECGKAALLGAVATRVSARGKGYASACVLTLSYLLQQENKQVLLSPKNTYAHRLYDKIGFSVVGEWGSVKRF